MACPDGARFTGEMFQTAMENFDLWEAMVCPYGTALGMGVVGTMLYSAFALNIFIRTGSVIIPFVLVMILGGTIIGQMVGVVSAFAGLIVLVVAPLVVSALIFVLDRQA